MNVKLLIGIVLFIIGLATAVVGIAGVASPGPMDQSVMAESESQTAAIPETASNMVIPFVAAICLAMGGLLIGISVGNWKHPRTEHKPGDEVVNPEGYHKMKHV